MLLIAAVVLSLALGSGVARADAQPSIGVLATPGQVAEGANVTLIATVAWNNASLGINGPVQDAVTFYGGCGVSTPTRSNGLVVVSNQGAFPPASLTVPSSRNCPVPGQRTAAASAYPVGASSPLTASAALTITPAPSNPPSLYVALSPLNP